MLILRLKSRNSMESNKSFIKLLLFPHSDIFFIFSLKFKYCITSCECMNFVTLYRVFRRVVSSMHHSSIDFSCASRTILSTFNKNDATSSFLLLRDVISNKQHFLISHKKRLFLGVIVILIISVILARCLEF